MNEQQLAEKLGKREKELRNDIEQLELELAKKKEYLYGLCDGFQLARSCEDSPRKDGE